MNSPTNAPFKSTFTWNSVAAIHRFVPFSRANRRGIPRSRRNPVVHIPGKASLCGAGRHGAHGQYRYARSALSTLLCHKLTNPAPSGCSLGRVGSTLTIRSWTRGVPRGQGWTIIPDSKDIIIVISGLPKLLEVTSMMETGRQIARAAEEAGVTIDTPARPWQRRRLLSPAAATRGGR
jgi:hypothetical protein